MPPTCITVHQITRPLLHVVPPHHLQVTIRLDQWRLSCLLALYARYLNITLCLWLLLLRIQAGQFDQVAARMSAAVKLNCGQKAVILAHSMGSNVVLHMLRQQRFQQWR